MIRQGRGKEPVGLRLFSKGDKYRYSDSIIRSSRIVCGAYSIRPYKRGCAPRPHLLCLSPIGAICGAYAIRPYVGGFAPRPHPSRLSPVGAICGAYAFAPYIGGFAPRPHPPRLSPAGAIWGAYAIRPYKRGCAPIPPAGAAYALRPLTVLCDPLYKCAGRLRVLVGWGRGVMGRVWGLNDLHIIY